MFKMDSYLWVWLDFKTPEQNSMCNENIPESS